MSYLPPCKIQINNLADKREEKIFMSTKFLKQIIESAGYTHPKNQMLCALICHHRPPRSNTSAAHLDLPLYIGDWLPLMYEDVMY